MQDQLENLRRFFPAEVTGSYLAVVGLLGANDVGPAENMWLMVWVTLALLVANGVIYARLRGVRDVGTHVILAVGFLSWVGNIDTRRFEDLPVLGHNIELIAPISLVFYTLVTGMIGIKPLPQPEEEEGRHA